MVARSCLYAFLLVVIYSIIIRHFNAGFRVGQDHQINATKAQNFIYRNAAPKNVIVGSSLSANLPMDSLNSFVDLAFSGQGLLDGLYILNHQTTTPANIFIETNKVFRDQDEIFEASLYDPVLYHMRAAFPILEEGRQPLAIIGDIIVDRWKYINLIRHPLTPKKMVLAKIGHPNNLDAFNLNMRFYKDGPNVIQLKNCINKLKLEVAKLQSRGARIIFFEMPVNCELSKLRESVIVRNSLHDAFPVSRFEYIPMPDCNDYDTNDGMHLTARDNLIYISYFKKMTEKYTTH